MFKRCKSMFFMNILVTKVLIINLLELSIFKFLFLSFIEERLLFFDCGERLHLRIPAAVGLLCVGFWRRVGAGR